MARAKPNSLRKTDCLAVLILVLISVLPAEKMLLDQRYVSERAFSNPDAHNYLVLASNLRDGKGFTPFGRDDLQDPWWLEINAQLEGLRPMHLYATTPISRMTIEGQLPRTTYHTPGYPVFLAGLMFSRHLLDSIRVILQTQVLLMAVASLALYSFLRRHRLGVPEALVLTSLFCLSPTLVLLITQVMTDAIYTCLSVLFLVAFMQFSIHSDHRSLMLSALVLCVISAIRPEFVVLSITYSVLILLRHGDLPFYKRLVFSGEFLAISCAFLLFWSFRSLQEYKVFKPSTSADVLISWSAAPRVVAAAQGIDRNTATRIVSKEVESELLRIEQEYERQLNAFERAGVLGRVGMRKLFSYWRTTLTLTLRAAFIKVFMFDMFSINEIIGVRLQSRDSGIVTSFLELDLARMFALLQAVVRSNPGWLVVLNVGVLVVHFAKLAMFGMSAIVLFLERKYFILTSLMIPVMFFTFSGFTEFDDRKFLPAVPFICVSIGIGYLNLEQLFSRVKNRIGSGTTK